MSNPLTDLLKRVLTEHQYRISTGCTCGWGQRAVGATFVGEHRTHVAQALADALGATVETEWGVQFDNGNVFDGIRSRGRALNFAALTNDSAVSRTRVRIPDLLGEWTETDPHEAVADEARRESRREADER